MTEQNSESARDERSSPDSDADKNEAHFEPLTLDQLMAKLNSRYEDKERLKKYREAEVPAIRTVLSLLEKQLSPRFSFADAFTPGGGGVPILLADKELGNRRCVLKLPRPVVQREAQLNRILASEIDRLKALSHPNIIHILLTGIVRDPEKSVPEDATPYYIMEHVSGGRDADHALAFTPTVEALLRTLHGTISALQHIHQQVIVHTDVKPGNIFVGADGRAILADFGFAKRLDIDNTATYLVGGTVGFMHREQVELLKDLTRDESSPSEQDRQVTPLDKPVERSQIKSYWDLYSLGISILVLLRVLEQNSLRARRDYRARYLRLMAYRLIGPELEYARVSAQRDLGLIIQPQVIGLGEKDTRGLAYRDMDEVMYDFEKLIGARDLLQEVPEVARYQPDVIHASSAGPVPFTDRVRMVVHTPEVRRLGSLTQLGLVNFVYPTASHTRLEHTLGTFGLACRYVRALYNDPINPIFKQIMRQRDVEALLLAALVHDVGHYPLAHDLEEVAPHVFAHGLRTDHLLTDVSSSELARVLSSESAWSVRAPDVLAILRAGEKPGEAPFRASVLSAILDGPVDADKLDYVVRDSESLRVPYGRGVDFDRIISSATVVMIVRKRGSVEVSRFPSLGIHDRGRIAAESLAFARYAMYGAVYWHRTHRTVKAMLNRLTYEALLQMSLDDEGQAKRGWPREAITRLNDFLDSPAQARLMPVYGVPANLDYGGSDAGFLDPITDQMITWLAASAGSTGDSLAEDIRQRNLYHRIMVVSEYRERDMPWSDIARVFGRRGQRDNDVWLRRLRFNELFQQQVTRLLAKVEPESVRDHSSVADPDKIAHFMALANSTPRPQPLVIVDYPIAKPGSPHGLSYLHEAEWHDPEDDPFEAVAADKSPVWQALTNELQHSLAKLRVYCHPDFSAVISAAVPRDELIRSVEGVLDALASEIG